MNYQEHFHDCSLINCSIIWKLSLPLNVQSSLILCFPPQNSLRAEQLVRFIMAMKRASSYVGKQSMCCCHLEFSTELHPAINKKTILWMTAVSLGAITSPLCSLGREFLARPPEQDCTRAPRMPSSDLRPTPHRRDSAPSGGQVPAKRRPHHSWLCIFRGVNYPVILFFFFFYPVIL